MATPFSDKIRIRLKAYDFRLLDQSTTEIVDTAKRTGARLAGPVPLPTDRLAAVRLMWVAMDAARRKDKPTRCVAIMPYADVLAPATSAAGGAQQDALVALALLQIMTDDALRRAGHLVVLAARVVRSGRAAPFWRTVSRGALGLSAACNAPIATPKFGVFRM